MADLAQVVGVPVAVLALIAVVVQLQLSRASARDQHTLAYLARYNNVENRTTLLAVRKFLGEVHEYASGPWLLSRWAATPSVDTPLPSHNPRGAATPPVHVTKADVYTLFTFFEELGSAFNAGLIDRRLAVRLFGALSVTTYEQAEVLFPPFEATFLNPNDPRRFLDRRPFRNRRRLDSPSLHEWGLMNQEIRRLQPADAIQTGDAASNR